MKAEVYIKSVQWHINRIFEKYSSFLEKKEEIVFDQKEENTKFKNEFQIFIEEMLKDYQKTNFNIMTFDFESSKEKLSFVIEELSKIEKLVFEFNKYKLSSELVHNFLLQLKPHILNLAKIEIEE